MARVLVMARMSSTCFSSMVAVLLNRRLLTMTVVVMVTAVTLLLWCFTSLSVGRMRGMLMMSMCRLRVRLVLTCMVHWWRCGMDVMVRAQ